MTNIILSFLVFAAIITNGLCMVCFDCTAVYGSESSCIKGIPTEMSRDKLTRDCDRSYSSKLNNDICVTFKTENEITRGCGNFWAPDRNPQLYMKNHYGAVESSVCRWGDHCNVGHRVRASSAD